MSAVLPARREVHCVVLAAGAGRRMGWPKLLLPYGGITVLERAVDAALGSGAGLTVVVLGYEAEAARKVLTGTYPGRPGLRVVVNRDYLSGQASSLRVGLRAVLDASGAPANAAQPADATACAGAAPPPASPRAVVFCLGDQPLITAETVMALIDAHLAAAQRPGPVVVAPVHAGRRGNPVLIDRSLFPELLTLTGDTGARGVLDRHAGEGTLLVPAGPEVLFDLDTPEDYARLPSGLRTRP